MSSMKTDRFVPMSTGKNMEPLSLPECVHLTERCRCGVLRVEECQGERCAFRKTERAYSTAYQSGGRPARKERGGAETDGVEVLWRADAVEETRLLMEVANV